MTAWTLGEIQQWRASHPAEALILYGAGDLGKLALEALKRADVRVDAYCDDSLLKRGGAWRNTPILSLTDLTRFERSARILLSMNYLTVVRPRLAAMGFDQVSTCAGLFEDLDLGGAEVGVHPLEIERKIAWHRRECAKEADEDYLTLKYIDVVITESCSMRCVDCSNLMQYYARPRHADFDQLCDDIAHLLSAVDWIDEIRVLGGEPLVNKRFGDIVRHITSHSNFRHLVVYTNATVLPGAATLAALADPRVTVNITDYGALSRRLEEFTALLQDSGVAHLVKQPAWTDSGRIRRQSKSPEELDAQFGRCCVNDILTLLHGRIYRCPFSANLTNLGVSSIGPSEVIEVNGEREHLRGALRGLYARKSHLTACGYCNGRDYTTPKIPAGIQTRRPLDIPID